MRGYLLAGGQSRRFGADKTRAMWRGAPLAVWAARALAQVADDGVWVVAPRAEEVGWLGLSLLRDALPGEGPAGALLAVVRAGGGLVLAADMPFFPPQALRRLALGQPSRPQALAWAGRIQPLAAWWPPQALEAVEMAVSRGERRAVALFCAAGGVVRAPWEVGLAGQEGWRLVSVNTPRDLVRLWGRA
jgi:molybdopterin-guanine dinucleotide biosynthesis protein A